MGKEPMETDEKGNGNTPSKAKGSRFPLRPVPCDEAGEGLPYAPENWPKPGDMWGWKVGKRLTYSGYHLDRFLYLPKSLCHLVGAPARVKNGFASKLSVQRFLQTHFPDANVEAFFDSFVWRIPSSQAAVNRLANGNPSLTITGDIDSSAFPVPPSATLTFNPQSGGGCKAGNKGCSSLEGAIGSSPPVPSVPCDICCTESGFCRDCCCILCSKIITSSHGAYNYIKCQSVVTPGCICSHLAHIECALRTYMAGTVGGSIGLDAEYLCRRCDAKTDMVPHAVKLLQTCKFIDSRDEVEKILNVGICILRGSRRNKAKDLLKRIELAAAKLRHGTTLEDVCKDDEDASDMDKKPTFLDLKAESPDYSAEILQLDAEIDDVLRAMRKSQKLELKLAEEQLHAKKRNLQNLYQQLQKEHSELACLELEATGAGELRSTVTSRIDQINWERRKLERMKRVANGFGRTSKRILREHFGLEVEKKPSVGGPS
ncbi:unnamed protein product [Linum tenue]|uniref:Oberon PHD finger domain-containing protein n=1 Tax=Linum tenue TaxID=586396 RepID=A0AAV0RPG6_9ROSI|nr:unnamed protein product [Linum tenue]